MRQSAPSLPKLGVILVIEASTAAGSLALFELSSHGTAAHPTSGPVRWRLLGSGDVPMGSGRLDVLTPAIQALLSEASVRPSALAAVVCGDGPGSFTSLRIAASTAKGLVWDSTTSLYGVPSLLLAAPCVIGSAPTTGRFLMAMDALRDESYVLPVDVDPVDGDAVSGDRADEIPGMVRAAGPLARVPTAALAEVAQDRTVCLVSATSGPPVASAARWLADWSSFGPVAVDAWEPSYGRLAEAQVKWEATHGRGLPTG